MSTPTLAARVRQQLGVSWEKAREAVRSGKVFVDGQRAIEPEARPHDTAVIEVKAHAPRPLTRDEIGKEHVLFEDNSVIVVNKPAGIESVPYGDREQGTLLHAVRMFVAKRMKDRPEVGIVHRLDKDTSGVMMFTLSFAAKKVMGEAFRKHTIERVYWALTQGAPSSGRIVSYIAEDRGDRRRGSVGVGEPKHGAKKAVTWVEVKERYQGAAWVECKLETGRTHQIRIHLSEAGAPVLGERVYASLADEAPRLMLHARMLAFKHPVTGKELRFEAEPPADFQLTREKLRRSSSTAPGRPK